MSANEKIYVIDKTKNDVIKMSMDEKMSSNEKVPIPVVFNTSTNNDDVMKMEMKETASLSGMKLYYDTDAVPNDPKIKKQLKRKILKNICLISLVFLLLFTSYGGLAALQSSLHKEEGMGTITQSVLYAAMVLSCLFIPKLLISGVGHKWAIPISMSGYILWMAANGYAVWGTMVTACILVGICAAPLWTAQCAYFAKVAPKYACLTGEKEEAVVAKFFGIFFCFFQLSGLIGSVISYTVLSMDANKNETLSPEEIQMYCGINDCPDNNFTNPNQEKPDETTLWTLVGIYMGIACVAVILVCTAVDQLPLYLHDNKANARKEAGQSALKTLLHLKNKSQCLMIPLTIYSGLEQGFFGAEWNRSYVSCSLGIWMVGLVTIPAAAVNALVSFGGGQIIKYSGRIPIITIGLVVNLTLQLVLLLWPLDSEKKYAYFLLAIGWEFTDAIWQTQINALYGSIFADNSEAAFSNYRMWESLGFIIAFAYSNFLCTNVKLYIVMGFLIVGMICYYIVEHLEKKKGVTGGLPPPRGRIIDIIEIEPSVDKHSGDVGNGSMAQQDKTTLTDPEVHCHGNIDNKNDSPIISSMWNNGLDNMDINTRIKNIVQNSYL